MEKIKIAVLGSTSHIAKGLIYNYSNRNDISLHLFARDFTKLKKFLESINYQKKIDIKNYKDVFEENYDVIINCVGMGTPDKINSGHENILVLTETYDNLVLGYLQKKNNALYINFSSGAVFGSGFLKAVNAVTKSIIEINDIGVSNFYQVAKLNSEVKHRSMPDKNIVDLRVFNYFSRFINLDSKYFITELLSAVKNKKVFKTNGNEMIRDFINHEDITLIIDKCIEKQRVNDSFVLYSKKPVTKFNIIKFFQKKYGLICEIDPDIKIENTAGTKSKYYSNNKKAENLGYCPKYTSLECIKIESKELLNY